ncbi:MAG: recombinase family protein [Lachnospiraceae bacterium]|nr:recombinase family protein [Lachnospiraceae bacterium]MBR1851979.1 recombinase family protein [Lachnospiraceae bacterium]
MTYGYARCSTNEERQDIDRQKRELFSLGVTDDKYIYWEYESGMKDDRAELQKLFDIVSEGDTIVTTEVSRLTRSTRHLCEILQTVKGKRLILDIGGSFRVDCSKGEIEPMTEGMIKMWGVFAEMERNIISQRVKSGMKNAAAKGKQIGRPETTKDALPDKFWKYYRMYQNEQINISDFARVLECTRPTIYRYIDIATKE